MSYVIYACVAAVFLIAALMANLMQDDERTTRPPSLDL